MPALLPHVASASVSDAQRDGGSGGGQSRGPGLMASRRSRRCPRMRRPRQEARLSGLFCHLALQVQARLMSIRPPAQGGHARALTASPKAAKDLVGDCVVANPVFGMPLHADGKSPAHR